ncbi:hypothetical protein [Providencia manganoxydans]|uniref:hypothetical protein n=1 Tax=Providencia manganoxydans TaxID=2923283 RepID=UPI0034E3DEBC
MRKPASYYDLPPDPYADYKMEAIYDRDKRNFESREKWFYVGADLFHKNRVKVGITMGDLGSRSYSSGNPDYFLFCAFQCQDAISPEQLRAIEKDVLKRLDKTYVDDDGICQRMLHAGSQYPSEWYRDVEFYDFVIHVHWLLFKYHSRFFIIEGLESHWDSDEDLLSCIFNERYTKEEQQRFRELFLVNRYC